MNIVIVGQGAMGLLWYHNIQQVINSHSEYNEAQLHLKSSKDSSIHNSQTQPYFFNDYYNKQHHGDIYYAVHQNIQNADFIIFCLKSFQISSALTSISNLLKNSASIVLAHNGMGTLSELPKKIVNKHNIYALLTTHGCLRSAPYIVSHTGLGSTDIGLISGETKIKEQISLTQLLNTALPCTKYHNEIKQKQWLKLAINCVINPLTAINDIENGQINEIEYKQAILSLLDEVVMVANAEGVNLSLNELIQTVENVARATAKNSSSMRCDILANRTSEIDYINGYIHSLGVKHGIATPSNSYLWKTVKSLEK